MNIPNLPMTKVIATKQGNNYVMNEEWHNVFSALVKAFQQNLSNEGYKTPQQPTTIITQLNTTQSTGAILYDKDVHSFVGNINGLFKTFTLT